MHLSTVRVVWEPTFEKKETKKKASKAIKNVIKIKPPVSVKPPKEKKPGCFECFKLKRRKKDDEEESEENLEKPKELPPTELSPEMEKANSEGYEMMKKVFFPSIPALAQDLWVFIEFAISIAAFAIGIVGIDNPLKVNVAFQIVYLILTSFAMLLALIDGFIYFFQMGSAARAIRLLISYCKKRRRKKEGNEEEEDDEEEDEGKSRCGMSAETREKFNTWFELIRNLTNEFLVYPILVFDMFDFITEGENGGYVPDPGDEDAPREQADFGFVVIGSFYLILAVYIMRVVMVFGTLASLIRLPSNKEASGTEKDTSLLIKFCIHIIGQIAVHFVIIVVIWAKIRNENRPVSDMSNTMNGTMNSTAMMNVTVMNSTTVMMDNITMMDNTTMMNATAMPEEEEEDAVIRASAFLITACVMGGILPLIGVAAFFIVNYFWMREFSIGFWLNMLSMLQGASFADTVFGGDGLSAAEEQANQFLTDSNFYKVKVQIVRLQEQTFWTKFFYPTKVPLVALCGVLYDIALVIFVTTLMFTYDENGVRLVVFQEDDQFMTIAFVISTTVIIVANIHVLLLLNFLLLVMILLGIVAVFYSAALLPLILLIYLPSVAFVGYYFIFKDSSGKMKKMDQADQEDMYALENMDSTEEDLELSEKEEARSVPV